MRVSPRPLISFRHFSTSSSSYFVCAQVYPSPWVYLILVSVCMYVCVFACVETVMLLLVFFRRSEVQLHGFVHLPVLFADKLKGERTVENSELVSSSWYVNGVLFL